MKPFLQGKKTLSIAPLRPPHLHHIPHVQGSKGQPAPANGASHPGWSVDVIKEGDKVTRIMVTCVCGERTEITCLYPAGE